MRKAYLSAVAYAVMIGFSMMFTKITINYVIPTTALAHRFIIGSLFFIVYRLVTRTKFSMQRKDISKILPLALSYPIGYFLLQALALTEITSGEVGILFAGSPVFALILSSIFINEKSTTLQKVGILVSITGVISIFIFGGTSLSSNLIGYIYGVLAAVVFAIYNTHARVTLRMYNFFEVTETLVYIGAVFFNIVAIPFGYENYIAGLGSFDYWIALLYIGIIASVFATFSATYALTKIKASQLTIFANLATLISILAGVLFLGESVYWYHIVATVMIITGVLLTNKEKTQT